MKTITLRELLRETRKVKQFTQGGATVLVTDNGKPLWKVSPVIERMDENTRRQKINEIFGEMIKEPKQEEPTLSQILDRDRDRQ